MKRAAVAAVSALLALASSASAEPPRVRLALDPCIANSAALRRLVTLELGATVIVDVVDVPDEPGLTRIDVRCDGESVSIEVTDPSSDKHLSRRLRSSARFCMPCWTMAGRAVWPTP